MCRLSSSGPGVEESHAQGGKSFQIIGTALISNCPEFKQSSYASAGKSKVSQKLLSSSESFNNNDDKIIILTSLPPPLLR